MMIPDTQTFTQDDIRDASALLAWGLKPNQRPAGAKEYNDLISRYFVSGGLRAALKLVTEGQSLQVLAVDPTEGLVLGADRYSPYATTIAHIRANTTENTNAKLAITLCVIIAAFFPNAESIETSEEELRALTVKDMQKLFLASIEELRLRHENDALDPEITHIWRKLSHMAPDSIKSADAKRDRANLKSIEGMIISMLKPLIDNGLVSRPSEGGTIYRARERFRLQLQQRTAEALLDFVRNVRVTPEYDALLAEATAADLKTIAVQDAGSPAAVNDSDEE